MVVVGVVERFCPLFLRLNLLIRKQTIYIGMGSTKISMSTFVDAPVNISEVSQPNPHIRLVLVDSVKYVKRVAIFVLKATAKCYFVGASLPLPLVVVYHPVIGHGH